MLLKKNLLMFVLLCAITTSMSTAVNVHAAAPSAPITEDWIRIKEAELLKTLYATEGATEAATIQLRNAALIELEVMKAVKANVQAGLTVTEREFHGLASTAVIDYQSMANYEEYDEVTGLFTKPNANRRLEGNAASDYVKGAAAKSRSQLAASVDATAEIVVDINPATGHRALRLEQPGAELAEAGGMWTRAKKVIPVVGVLLALPQISEAAVESWETSDPLPFAGAVGTAGFGETPPGELLDIVSLLSDDGKSSDGYMFHPGTGDLLQLAADSGIPVESTFNFGLDRPDIWNPLTWSLTVDREDTCSVSQNGTHVTVPCGPVQRVIGPTRATITNNAPNIQSLPNDSITPQPAAPSIEPPTDQEL